MTIAYALAWISTLDTVTYEGDLDPATYSSMTVQGGLTVTDSTGARPDTVNFGYDSGLRCLDTQTFNNPTINPGGGISFLCDAAYQTSGCQYPNEMLTLGSNLTIVQTESSNTINSGGGCSSRSASRCGSRRSANRRAPRRIPGREHDCVPGEDAGMRVLVDIAADRDAAALPEELPFGAGPVVADVAREPAGLAVGEVEENVGRPVLALDLDGVLRPAAAVEVSCEERRADGPDDVEPAARRLGLEALLDAGGNEIPCGAASRATAVETRRGASRKERNSVLMSAALTGFERARPMGSSNRQAPIGKQGPRCQDGPFR